MARTARRAQRPATGGGQRLRATPAVVWALVGVHGLLMVLASVLYPTYRAPDEGAHVDMVLLLAGGAGYPDVGERQLSQRVLDSQLLVGHDRTGERTPLEAGEAPPRDDRPGFAELGPNAPSDVPQQMAAHPPLYYLAAATTLSALTAVLPEGAGLSFDQVVGFLRLLGALLFLPLPLLAYRTAQRLAAPASVALTAAVLPLGIPQLTHIGASVNNDTLLVLLLAVLTLPTLSAARRDTSGRTALVAGLVGGLALLTKGFALIVPVWLVGVYLLGAARGGGPRAVGAGTIALLTATGVGGWWWIRNLLTFGTVQPSGLPSPPTPAGFVPDVGAWLAFFVQRMSVRFWIEPDVVPEGAPPLDLVATVIVVVCGVAAFVGYRHVRQQPADLAVLLVPLAGLGAIVIFGAWRVYARTGLPVAIHGRYLYGGVVGLGVVAAFGAAALLRQRERWLPLAAFVVAAVAQVAAMALALAEYWAPPGLGERTAAVLAWAPWPAPMLVGTALGAVALAIWTLAALVREGRA